MAVPIPRNYTRLALSIVIAAVVIGGAIVASSYVGTFRTVTVIRTSASAQTGASELYQVEFLQEPNCPPGSWLFPWAVVLDNQTVVQPSNATLPLSSDGIFHFTDDSNYSTIGFSLPNGTYSYTIIPDYSLGSHQSGNVTVDGSDVTVQVYAFVTANGCSSTNSAPSG